MKDHGDNSGEEFREISWEDSGEEKNIWGLWRRLWGRLGGLLMSLGRTLDESVEDS